MAKYWATEPLLLTITAIIEFIELKIYFLKMHYNLYIFPHMVSFVTSFIDHPFWQ